MAEVSGPRTPWPELTLTRQLGKRKRVSVLAYRGPYPVRPGGLLPSPLDLLSATPNTEGRALIRPF